MAVVIVIVAGVVVDAAPEGSLDARTLAVRLMWHYPLMSALQRANAHVGSPLVLAQLLLL